MDDRKAYVILFNAIAHALTELARAGEKCPEMMRAVIILQFAQQQTEEWYIEG